ncbi:MAG: hypothetical protein P8130_06930 [Deltaproteobacteria bacterium]
MTTRKVWGVIIIVFGIFLFFTSASKAYEADLDYKEIRSVAKSFSQAGGLQFYDSVRHQKLLVNEKNNGVVGAFLGIAMAVGGIRLFRERRNVGILSRKNYDNSPKLQSDYTIIGISQNQASALGAEININGIKDFEKSIEISKIAITTSQTAEEFSGANIIPIKSKKEGTNMPLAFLVQ